MSLQDKRIFLVEDGVENRAIIQTLLERSGAKIAFDRWGIDTIKRLQMFAPVELILLDLMLPNRVTGYDVFDRIRAVSDFADVPIVAVSASDPSEAVPKTKAKGLAGFIAKPIDFEVFPLQIERILNREAVGQLR